MSETQTTKPNKDWPYRGKDNIANLTLERARELFFCHLLKKKSDDECWEWGNGKGNYYPAVGVGKTSIRVSRLAYFAHTGVRPGTLMVCHKCDNVLCVNPHHLFLGTNTDNQRDSSRKGRTKRDSLRRTHCKRGHEYTPENTLVRIHDGYKCRACATCAKISRQTYLNKFKRNTEISAENVRLREWAIEAFHQLQRGAELIPLHHLGDWEGVRGTIETCPIDFEVLQATKESVGKIKERV